MDGRDPEYCRAVNGVAAAAVAAAAAAADVLVLWPEASARPGRDCASNVGAVRCGALEETRGQDVPEQTSVR